MSTYTDCGYWLESGSVWIQHTFPAFLYILLLSCSSAASGGLAPDVSPTDADWHPSNAGPDKTSKNDSNNSDRVGIGDFQLMIVLITAILINRI